MLPAVASFDTAFGADGRNSLDSDRAIKHKEIGIFHQRYLQDLAKAVGINEPQVNMDMLQEVPLVLLAK